MKDILKKRGIIAGIIIVCLVLSAVLSGCLMKYVDENFDDGIAQDWSNDGGKWSVKMITPTDGKYCWFPVAPQIGIIPDQSTFFYTGFPGHIPGFTNFSIQFDAQRLIANELDQTVGIVFRHISGGLLYCLFLVDFYYKHWYFYVFNSYGKQLIADKEEYYLIDYFINHIEVDASRSMSSDHDLFNFYINDQKVYTWSGGLGTTPGALGIFAQGYTNDEVRIDNIIIFWDEEYQNLQKLYQRLIDRYPNLEQLLPSRSVINKNTNFP